MISRIRHQEVSYYNQLNRDQGHFRDILGLLICTKNVEVDKGGLCCSRSKKNPPQGRGRSSDKTGVRAQTEQ